MRALLTVVYGEYAMKKWSVFEWHRRFNEGREDVLDDPRNGQTKTKGQTQMWTEHEGALRSKSRFGSNNRRIEYLEDFRRLKIMPVESQYLLSLLLFVAENTEYFRLNSEIHSFNTKNKCNLH